MLLFGPFGGFLTGSAVSDGDLASTGPMLRAGRGDVLKERYATFAMPGFLAHLWKASRISMWIAKGMTIFRPTCREVHD